MTILQAVCQLRPGTSWNLRGDVLEQAIDGNPRVSPPSAAEIKALLDADAYKEKRAMAYPPISDQLDALWKGGEAAAEMLAQIQAVKAKFPKPS